MHVFKEGRCRARSTGLASMAQFLIGILGVLLTGVMLGVAMEEGGDTIVGTQMLFGFAVFGFIFQSARTWATFFGKSGARVILTSKTLAVKFRKKPAQFFKRGDCMAYAPEERVFCFEGGEEFSPRVFVFVIDDWQLIPDFILEHWWPEIDLNAMKKEIDLEFPISRWALTLYFGEIFAGLVIAMFATIGGISGWLAMPTVYGLLCLFVLVECDWIRRHLWLLRRESERRAVQFDLP